MIERIKQKCKLQKVIHFIPSILFLGFIFYVMLQLFLNGTIPGFVENMEFSYAGIEAFSDTFEEDLQENFYNKYDFINLNGWTAKTLGINSLNKRQKLANGYLAHFGHAGDNSSSAENVIALNKFLNDRDIDFVYLLAPTKTAFYDIEFSPGYNSDKWKEIDTMISTLDEADVLTIDMDAWFEENGWTFEDVYFKTDHHWLPGAALAAARVTMELLSEQGMADYQEEYMMDDSYTVDTLEDWFLGSEGKRVGEFYAGVDDFELYLPDFPTNYSYSGLHAKTTNWSYEDSPLDLSYLENKDYFGSDPYCIYLYGELPLQIVVNRDACNGKKLLVIGDSYRRAWEYFMTMEFQQIYSVDLRYYTDGTLAQYIEEIQPDIVIMCTDNTTNKKTYSFGVEEYLSAIEESAVDDMGFFDLGSISISAQEDNDHFSVITTDLDPNQAYTLTVASTSYSGGEDLYIQMTLQDLSTKTAVYNRYFDANSNDKQKWIFTVPENENDMYAIYLYAGTKGHTDGVSIDISNIQLQKGIIEN